jgi:hypothetical protein
LLGATVLVSVPAWQALYTRHDLFLGHYQRYRPAKFVVQDPTVRTAEAVRVINSSASMKRGD